MGKGANQKLKIIYLMKIFLEKTDETHSISMAEILSSLETYGISAERKSIYADIECLKMYGMDIIGESQNRTYYYHVGNRQFELAELKLLVDSVQSAKFITTRKSNELIKKIEGFASKYEAQQLQRQVYVSERVKTINENIYYNVDKIHAAIGANSKIKFQYYQWNVDKKMELKHDGAYYEISPWALSWDDENYYLIAYEDKEECIKHFRVDKMLNIEATGKRREGLKAFRDFDMAVYAKKMFGMFNGKEQMVKLECENYMAGVIIDRFGKEIMMIKKDTEHFVVNVKVAVSRQFLGWIISLGSGVKIIGPDIVVEEMQREVRRLVEQYLAG
ncbi:MAG: WYL domain-containing protein [Lachnospiraceae bacterium]|nr:WYL domain-containing protein [Lachnospiraceae bacterium]MDD3617138.1 WYL domain-containing protein [Lachnospiraceae bacterium]